MDICPISVKLRETLNYVKGIIYAPCCFDVPEEGIVKELRCQGVVPVYKFMKKVDNSLLDNDRIDDRNTNATKQVYLGYMVISFNLYNLPKIIDVARYKVKVRTYFPNPMRCKNFQILGHTKNKCKIPVTCNTCNLPPHPDIQCTIIQYANCSEKHPSSDRNCPRYIQQKEIKYQNYN